MLAIEPTNTSTTGNMHRANHGVDETYAATMGALIERCTARQNAREQAYREAVNLFTGAYYKCLFCGTEQVHVHGDGHKFNTCVTCGKALCG